MLIYATCSVLLQENDQVVAQFLATNNDASVDKIEADWGEATDFGRQIFPGKRRRWFLLFTFTKNS